jgi:D-alanine-D-alanine ligase
VSTLRDDVARQRLLELERGLVARARDLALFLVYDRPSRVAERPGLARTYFAQRCVSDEQLQETIDAFRAVGAYVELFEGERPLLAALADGRLACLGRELQVIYNGIGWGIGAGGFQAGRKALIPLIADSYGVLCANSDAYACTLTLHKFHCYTVLRSLGVPTPQAWHYRVPDGWIGDPPSQGARVIAKSTYEAWSVGVTDGSVFVVDESCERHVASIADAIGQAVTVQEFIPGREVYVPVISCPEPTALPPIEAVLERAPGDPDAVMTIEDNLRDGAVRYVRCANDPDLIELLARSAVHVFDLLGLDGFTRIDFRVDDEGQPWLIDVAVSPGLGAASAAFSAFASLGIEHPAFLRVAVAASLASRGLLNRPSSTTRLRAS